MASYTPWSQLNAKQRKMAVERWHKRNPNGAVSQTKPKANPADTDPLYDPTSTLSGGALKTAVNEIVSGQLRPAYNALDRQASTDRVQSNALAARVAGYSGQVDKRADVAAARQQAISERLNQQLATIGQAGQATADRVQADEGARRQADAALSAAPANAPDPVADELAAIRARSGADAQAAQTAGAVQGSNYEGLANSNRGAMQLRGQEQQTEIANRLANDLADIRAKRADLGTQAGAERTKQLLGLRQSGFENLITAQGLGIKQTQLQADILNQRKNLDLAARRQQSTESRDAANQANTAADNARADQSLATTESRDAYQRENQLGPYKPAAGKTPAQESADAKKIKTGVLNASVDFKDLLSNPDKKGRTRTVARVEEILRKRGAPPIVILAAGDIAQHGFVTAPHRKALKIAGVQIPKSWLPGAGVKPSKNATEHPRT